MTRGTRLPRRMASGKALFTSVKVRSRDGSFQFAEKTVMSVVRRGAERRELLCRRTDDARQGAFVLEVEDQLFHNIPTFFRNCWRWQQLLSQYDIKITISQYISIVIVALWI